MLIVGGILILLWLVLHLPILLWVGLVLVVVGALLMVSYRAPTEGGPVGYRNRRYW